MSREQALATATQNAGATPPPEATTPPAPETPAAPTPTELDSTRFAALAKREAKFQKEREEFKAQQEDLRKKITPFQEFEALRSKDPVAALRSLGFSDTDLFNFLSSHETKELTADQKAEAIAQKKIDEFRKEQDDKAKKEQDDRATQVVGQFKKTVADHLEVNKAKYPRCAQLGDFAKVEVFRLIEQVAKDTGEVMELGEAYQMYEDFHKGEYEEMKKLYEPVTATPEAAAQAAAAPVSNVPKTKTVTNSATPTVASTVNRRETLQEKKERLMNALKTGNYPTK